MIKKPTLILTLCSALTLTVCAEYQVVTTGTVMEAGKSYESISSQAALTVSGSETFYSGTNLTLSSTFGADYGRLGAYVYNQGRLDLYNVTSTNESTSQGRAILAVSSLVALYGGTFSTTGTYAWAIVLDQASSGYAENITVHTAGPNGFGVVVTHTSTLTLTGATITSSGPDSANVFIEDNSTLLASNLAVIANGSGGNGALLAMSARVVLTGSNLIVATGTGNYAVRVQRSIADLGDHTTIRSENFHGLQVVGIVGYDTRVTGTNTQISAPNPVNIEPTDNTGETSLTLVNPNIAATNAAVTIFGSGTGVGTITITGGTISAAQALIATTEGWNKQYTANADITLDSVTVNTDSLLDSSGTSVINLTVANTTLTGDTNVKGNSTATINFNHSAYTGDITQNDSAIVTIILDDGATGSGGFNGGNLITGEDSVWTFNKDSHVNNGNNNGTFNIGDHEVTFDHLTNTGTITISVNSDTGEGGSITVTGTADGEGTVHIDTTGNGKADPNDVLPGKVTGNGTENWQWDPIDWGIDTIIKDGDHFIKQGTSPAGAVLNSAIAVQQSMWFAQQNSLLKRMGELRYGARASRPLADKDVRVPYNLIENIWLRSYGQQLNVGSRVAGQAYEQLIYGVDLGTDHKFTISADSDLYLGVYAGYGRSDLDYRTPGADGDLNSYYGGLYATWLHASGFYIDATIKAASVNNDLKAPYGNTQLKASYSDVNIGGSIEIGKKFTFADAWFIEPQFQVNYLHILAENYAAGPMTISAQDLDTLQLRLGSLFGRTINLTNGGALQPYLKISGVETISSGGTLRNGYQHTRANTDGARAELGAGLIWQLDANNQLHLDYEASFGDKYDKPWGLTAGYRHQF